ncbi:MAG: hypothetical protein Kow0029_20010 [Candidatus Rifleibacteriota bacterium]
MKPQIHALILAAGKGTRMKSELPKVVHPILGKPMVSYVIEAVKAVGSVKTILVTGYKSDLVRQTLGNTEVEYVEQAEQLGTGHAVQCYVNSNPEKPDHLLVVCGDTPLISTETLQEMIELHLSQKPAITMMTLEMKDPGNYGRILRDEKGIKAVREAKDCTAEELKIKEVNLAVYIFESRFLFDNIFKLNSKNKQNEYYLTDLIEMAYQQGLSVLACKEKDETSTLGINSRQHLALVNGILQKKILEKHMENGVTIVDPSQTLIGPDCLIASDTTIWPGTLIEGSCIIGSNCEIGPNCHISNAKLGNNCRLQFCVIENAELESNSYIKPFSTIRSGADH